MVLPTPSWMVNVPHQCLRMKGPGPGGVVTYTALPIVDSNLSWHISRCERTIGNRQLLHTMVAAPALATSAMIFFILYIRFNLTQSTGFCIINFKVIMNLWSFQSIKDHPLRIVKDLFTFWRANKSYTSIHRYWRFGCTAVPNFGLYGGFRERVRRQTTKIIFGLLFIIVFEKILYIYCFPSSARICKKPQRRCAHPFTEMCAWGGCAFAWVCA